VPEFTNNYTSVLIEGNTIATGSSSSGTHAYAVGISCQAEAGILNNNISSCSSYMLDSSASGSFTLTFANVAAFSTSTYYAEITSLPSDYMIGQNANLRLTVTCSAVTNDPPSTAVMGHR